MTEILAGIDPSTSTGICILQDGKVVYTDLLKIKKPGDDAGKAYAFFADSVWALFVRFGVQAFAVETKIPMGNIPGNAKSFDLATVLYGRCEEIAARLNIEMTGIAVQSWRSVFLRKSTAPKNFPVPDHILPTRAKEYQASQRKKWWKQQALDACEARGIQVKNHDVAEAVGIAMSLWARRHPLGLDGANDLFQLPASPAGERLTLTLPGARSEAERVFSKFGEAAAEEE